MATRRPCTSPCPPPIWAPVLANEFCRIFSIPRFIFACTLSGAIASGYIVPGPKGLGPEFFGGSKQDAWIGIWIVIRAACGHCGHILGSNRGNSAELSVGSLWIKQYRPSWDLIVPKYCKVPHHQKGWNRLGHQMMSLNATSSIVYYRDVKLCADLWKASFAS